jgi:amino acid adenylation domain-containing protein
MSKETMMTLPELLARSVKQHPDRVAAEEPSGASITYATLDDLSNRLAAGLRADGVRPGDRVGLCLPKTIDALIAIFGALKAGAAYVPVDPYAPASRCAYILNDCSVRVIVVDDRLADGLLREIEALGTPPKMLRLTTVGGGRGIESAVAAQTGQAIDLSDCAPKADDLAYILYTSGSTGRPKGVMLSHRNAVSFVDWCSEVFEPTAADRFSSHAPLHFDLSILDLYVPLKHGATVILIGAELGKEPMALAELIAARAISVWYSTPSILSLLAQYGKLQRFEYPALRTVLFAGEVFPVKHLRSVQGFWPAPRYYNLYGPTETNVCTWYEVPGRVPADRTEPYPIGKVCSHLRARVVDGDGNDVAQGVEGELVITGPGVMQGYWNLPDNTAHAFLVDDAGEHWYRTGDIVIEEKSGDYIYIGRRDRMVKRRGYRIELGEIEAGLYKHASIREAAVVASKDADGGVKITACISFKEGTQLSTIELKRFCAEVLPMYMVPDAFALLTTLPKTSTDKIDYQRLLAAV